MMRIPDIQAHKARGEKIVMLTAYEAWMARVLAGVRGGRYAAGGRFRRDGRPWLRYHDSGDHERYGSAYARRAGGRAEALIVADMPFLSHQIGISQAMRNAGRLMQHGGASAVKLEGGGPIVTTVERIVAAGIPVMGHLGLQPQSVHAQGGFRRQATRPEEQHRLIADAVALGRCRGFRDRAGMRCQRAGLRGYAETAHTDDRHRLRTRLRRPGSRDA